MLYKRSKYSIRPGGWFIILALLFVTLSLICTWAFRKCAPLILPLATQELNNLISDELVNALKEIDMEDITAAKYTEEGKISAIFTDTVKLNEVSAVMTHEIEDKLSKEKLTVYIPLGDLAGKPITLGRGPKIAVKVTEYKDVSANLESEFFSAGINQTVYRLYINMNVTAVLVMPAMKTEEVISDIKIPLGETVIVGETPKTYIE